MNKILSFFDLRVRPEISMMLLSIMIMLFNGLIVIGFWNKPEFEILIALRAMHFCVALICLITIFQLRRRWNLRLAKIFFSILMLPLFAIAWFNHAAMIHSQDAWIPFKGFYIIVLGLAIVAPAGYLLNFYFLLGFIVQIITIWYVLDIPHRSNMILSGEPYYILGTSIACLLLLLSRYQDEQKIKYLVAEKTKGEFAKNLARVLLTMRDRVNTPLQNMSLLIHLLKTSPEITPRVVAIFEDSVQNIINSNRQFNRLEALINWKSNHLLMSDEEIDAWIGSLDKTKEAYEGE